MKRICLDAGVLGIYFSEKRSPAVKKLMDAITANEYNACMLKHVVIETYFHLCRAKGSTEANIQVANLMAVFPINFIDLDETLILHAGKLRCQHANTLSYNDCITIAFCLREGAELHTTEKLLKQIPHNVLQRLRIVKYDW